MRGHTRCFFLRQHGGGGYLQGGDSVHLIISTQCSARICSALHSSVSYQRSISVYTMTNMRICTVPLPILAGYSSMPRKQHQYHAQMLVEPRPPFPQGPALAPALYMHSIHLQS